MRVIFVALAILMMVADVPAQDNKGPYKIKRGTNIAHWLSQSKTRGKERADFFTKKDVQYIAKAGFDHFRLPVDEEQLWDESGKRNADAFSSLTMQLNGQTSRAFVWCSICTYCVHITSTKRKNLCGRNLLRRINSSSYGMIYHRQLRNILTICWHMNS